MAINGDLTIYEEGLADDSSAIWTAFGLPLVEDLSDPVPVEDLRNQERMQIISRMVSEIVRCQTVPDALEMVRRLRLYKNLNQNEPQVYKAYSRMINLLRFVSLYAQRDREIQNRISEGLAQALFADIDVKDRLETLFKDEKDYGPDKEQRRSLAHALEGNQEWVGQKALVNDEGKTVPPSVQDWLKVYNRSQPVYTERSNFNQINFLNADRQVQTLSPKEKKVLEEVLEIYDWLLFPPPEIAVVDQQKINEYINQQNLTLPKDFELSLDKTRDLRPQTEDSVQHTVPSVEESDNEKTAQLRAVSGPEPVLKSGILTDKDSISNRENLSSKQVLSGGPDGNRTRGTELSRFRPAPAPAHLDTLYHGDELQQAKGISFGGKRDTISNIKDQMSKPKAPVPPVLKPKTDNLSAPRQARDISPSLGEKNMEESIDQKLEELKRKAEKNKNT